MKVVTWNLNSIRAREERLLNWLSRQSPDVVCLQETKVTDEQFPYDAVKEQGYHAAVHGQKTYNGVAILSREPIEDIRVGFGDGVDDPQARCICGMVQGIRFVSVYVPNGDKVESDKYVYKREWLERLRAYLDKTRVPETPLLISGDFNIVPDAADAADPDAWRGSVLFNPDMTAVMSAPGLGPPGRGPEAQSGAGALFVVGLPAARVSTQPGAAHRPHPGHAGSGFAHDVRRRRQR